MGELIIHEPLASQLREAAAAANLTPDAFIALLLDNWERQRRLRKNATIAPSSSDDTERSSKSE